MKFIKNEISNLLQLSTGEYIDRRIDIDGWIDGRMDGWMHTYMHACKDAWINK